MNRDKFLTLSKLLSWRAFVLSHFSHVRLCVTIRTVAHQALCPWDSPGKNTGVGCYFLLQGIFPTQGSNPGLPHCRQTLYPLSHQGSPIISYVEHLFMYPLAICVSSLEKCLFRSSAHCLVGLLVFFCHWVVWVLCIFWKLGPCQLHHLQIFFPSL